MYSCHIVHCQSLHFDKTRIMNPYSDVLKEEASADEPFYKRQKIPDKPEPAPDTKYEQIETAEIAPLPLARRSVDMAGALSKLKSFLTNEKYGERCHVLSMHFKCSYLCSNRKARKAIAMILQLVEQRLDVDNIQLFIEIWDDFPFSRLLPTETNYFPDLCKISKVMWELAENSVCVTREHRFEIQTIFLATLTRRDLNTDDTGQFNKCCKQVQFLIESLKDPALDIPRDFLDKLIYRRKETILFCMADAFRLYKRQWAKQPVDLLFRAAASHRLCFEGELLARLDSLTECITIEQRAASANTGPRTIRTFDSTAHPLRQKILAFFDDAQIISLYYILDCSHHYLQIIMQFIILKTYATCDH